MYTINLPKLTRSQKFGDFHDRWSIRRLLMEVFFSEIEILNPFSVTGRNTVYKFKEGCSSPQPLKSCLKKTTAFQPTRCPCIFVEPMTKDDISLCGTSDNYPRNNASYLTSLGTSISCTENSLQANCRAACDNLLDEEVFLNIPRNCPCMREKLMSGLLETYSNQNNPTQETLYSNVILAPTPIENAASYRVKDAEHHPGAPNHARAMPKKIVNFTSEPDNIREPVHTYASVVPATNEGTQTDTLMGPANFLNAESGLPHSLLNENEASSHFIAPPTSDNNNNPEQDHLTELVLPGNSDERNLLNAQYSIEKRLSSSRNSNLGSTNLELLHDPSDEIVLDDNFAVAPFKQPCHCLKQKTKGLKSRKKCSCMETVSSIYDEPDCTSDRTTMGYNRLSASNQYDGSERQSRHCHCVNKENDSEDDSWTNSYQTNSCKCQSKDTRKYSKCKSNEINVCNRPVEMSPQLVKYIMGKCREVCPCKPRTKATIEGLVDNMDNCLKKIETTSRLITVDMQDAVNGCCPKKPRNHSLQPRCPCTVPRGQEMVSDEREDVREYNRYNTNGIFGGKGYIGQEHGFYFQGKSGLDACCQTRNYADKCVPNKVCCRCMSDKIVQDLRNKDLLEKKRNLRGELPFLRVEYHSI